MNHRFKLLVFDWDGTLMDSAARISACMRAAAADLELPVPSDQAARNIIGLGLKQALQQLFPGVEESLSERIVERYRHHFLHVDKTPSSLFSGAGEVIESLAEAGYLLAVATGKGRPGLNQVLQQTALGPRFHATRSADETHSKPHPEMLLQILDELGVAAAESLMIGDTEYDMQMAVSAGVPRLAVSYGVHDRARLMQHQPLGCLDQISDLPAWLDHHTLS